MDFTKKSFPYKAIPTQSSEIRVMHLLPGTFGDWVHCTIEHLDLGVSPTYAALSYVWGDPSITTPILLGHHLPESHQDTATVDPLTDFQEFQITKNLHAALQHIRSETEQRTIWIDAICINQQDLKERGHQVQLMGRIYANASEVLVWLGTFYEESDRKIPDTLGMQNHESIPKAFEYIEVFNRECERLGCSFHNAPVHEPEFQLSLPVQHGLTCIFVRPWFTRIWVLQEVTLARTMPIILCGTVKTSLLYALVTAFHYVRWLGLRRVSRDHLFQSMRVFRTLEAIKGREDYWGLPVIERVNKCLHFTSGVFEASEQHDKLYALLGMIGDTGDVLELIPSYEKPLHDFYVDLAQLLIKEVRCLALLDSAPGNLDSLPSWVPTWDKEYPSYYDFSRFRDLTTFAFSSSNQHLQIRSVSLGAVSYSMKIDANCFESPSILRRQLRDMEENILHMLSVSAKFPTTEEARQAFRAHLLKRSGLEEDREQFLDLYDGFLRHSDSSHILQDLGTDEGNDEKWMSHYLRSNLENLTIILTTSGWFGNTMQDPLEDARSGNTVHLVPGCQKALILRRGSSGYRIVGQCDIHGFCDLEAEEQLEIFRAGTWSDITII